MLGMEKEPKNKEYLQHLGSRPQATIPSSTPSILLAAAADASRRSPPSPPRGSRRPSRGNVAVHRPLLLAPSTACVQYSLLSPSE